MLRLLFGRGEALGVEEGGERSRGGEEWDENGGGGVSGRERSDGSD